MQGCELGDGPISQNAEVRQAGGKDATLLGAGVGWLVVGGVPLLFAFN